jgi:hypothetical protein
MEVSISTYKDWIYWMGTGLGLGLTYKFNNDLTSDELEKFSNVIKEATEVYYSLYVRGTAALHRRISSVQLI